MRVQAAYNTLAGAGALDASRAAAIAEMARPLALGALGRADEPAEALVVSTERVAPAQARGGSIIPAWPSRQADGSVRIEFVDDWGVMLAAWRAGLDEAAAQPVDVDQLLQSGERVWVGIANDVLQMYVVDPPAGTYSMVRHHALMLAAATSWLGPESTQRWRLAHRWAAISFLKRTAGRQLWDAIDAAEQGLDDLLANPRVHGAAPAVVDWLDMDPAAGAAYTNYLGAASLGVVALLDGADGPEWVQRYVRSEHSRPDFNRLPIERFAATYGLP
jgi:hypothetical protein